MIPCFGNINYEKILILVHVLLSQKLDTALLQHNLSVDEVLVGKKKS